MKPLDPRLLRYARSTRVFLVASVLVGAVNAGLLVAQALLLADVITSVFLDGEDLAAVIPLLQRLALVVVGRAALAYLSETLAFRASARAKTELRSALLEHAVALGPVALGRRRAGELATLATRGVDALDALLQPLPAPARARRHRAGGGARGAAGPRPARCRHRRAHAAAHPGVHGADRLVHPDPRRPAVADAGSAVRPLPRRRRGAADARGLRPGPRPGRGPSGTSASSTAARRCACCGWRSCRRWRSSCCRRCPSRWSP